MVDCYEQRVRVNPLGDIQVLYSKKLTRPLCVQVRMLSAKKMKEKTATHVIQIKTHDIRRVNLTDYFYLRGQADRVQALRFTNTRRKKFASL